MLSTDIQHDCHQAEQGRPTLHDDIADQLELAG